MATFNELFYDEYLYEGFDDIYEDFEDDEDIEIVIETLEDLVYDEYNELSEDTRSILEGLVGDLYNSKFGKGNKKKGAKRRLETRHFGSKASVQKTNKLKDRQEAIRTSKTKEGAGKTNKERLLAARKKRNTRTSQSGGWGS